ncbi:MAG: hypothetical protein WD399_00420 [Thermoleophilaceae bacterium]
MQDQRRLDIRTLAIASVASATAAALTSQFWIKGTPIAAAVTPVVVALISEMLHRPTERIAQRLTADTGASPRTADEPAPPRQPPAGPADAAAGAAGGGGGRRRRVAIGAALATGALAFATAALALSVPELITGQSLFNSDRRTTLGGAKVPPAAQEPPASPEPAPAEPEPQRPERESERERSEPEPQRRPRQRTTTETTPEKAPPPTTTTETETTESPSSRTLDPSGTATPGAEVAPVGK